MDEASRSIYDTIISDHVKARNNETTSKSSEVAAQKNLFTALRKAANHPLLLRTRHTDEKDVDTLARLLFSYGYFGSDATCTLQLVKNELANFSDYDIHCAGERPITLVMLLEFSTNHGIWPTFFYAHYCPSTNHDRRKPKTKRVLGKVYPCSRRPVLLAKICSAANAPPAIDQRRSPHTYF